MPKRVEIGRVLSAGTTSFVAGCRVNQLDLPSFGAMVWAPAGTSEKVFGLIHNARIQDDGLVRQLVTAENVSSEVILDNRERRIVPVEMSVVVVGYESADGIHHQLPPHPPLSLDPVYLCDHGEARRFTSRARLGYLRHLLRMPELPLGELLAAHVLLVRSTHPDPVLWTELAVKEMITLLRDDYPLLTSVLGALDSVVLRPPNGNSHN